MKDNFIPINESMSTSKMMGYIFIPPFLTMILYIFLSISMHAVLPTILLFFISALIILFPTQIYLILRDSKNIYGEYSLKSALQDQKEYRLWFIILIGMLTFGFAGLMTLIVMPLEASLFSFLSEKLYHAIPDYFNWSNLDIVKSYSKSVLIITGVSYIILNGFVGPIVEELFFRGFLTRKLKLNNWLAPLIMTILFSIYHFWMPFSLIFRIIAFFPAFYFTWKLRNIKISIIFHCLSNIFTATMFFITILSL